MAMSSAGTPWSINRGALADGVANLLVRVRARDDRRRDGVERAGSVAAERPQLTRQGGVALRGRDRDDPTCGLAGEPLQERDLRRMKRVGDDEDSRNAASARVIDRRERGKRGALVADVEGDQTMPSPHDHLDQCRRGPKSDRRQAAQRRRHDVRGPQCHGHVHQRFDRGRMVTDAAQQRPGNRRRPAPK